MREMQDRFGPMPPRFDMPWVSSGGRSPSRPMMEPHRSRSKLKKLKTEKNIQHGQNPRDPKMPSKESEKTEKERRTHREKARLRDVEREIRVKKAPFSAHEEKAALRYIIQKDGVERALSHGSPHGKPKKRREEAQPKELRAKLTDKPAVIKELAMAVSTDRVKTPKEEPTAKTLPEGEAMVAVKKPRKSKQSKSKMARIKGSKKTKKSAVNGETQSSEKTIKRPGSLDPSTDITEAVSPPKKAKMEPDTTSHEDDIPAKLGEEKVPDTKVKTDPIPGKERPQPLGLAVAPPELSKWERDDYDMNDMGVSPRRKTEVKRSLPR